jgi:hypothetical protein
MKIEIYQIPVLLVGVYHLYLYAKRKDSTEIVYKKAAPLNLMVGLLGILLFVFFIFN